MITRIVRMSFQEEKTEQFLELFENSKEKIRKSQGCLYLSLHQDHHHPHIFYTLSRWQSQSHLDQYRKSDLFKSTWSLTRQLFAGKPQAFSLEEVTELP